MDYDCTIDVLKHRIAVATVLLKIMESLLDRLSHHDESKLLDPIEKALFDKWTPELRTRTFGTDAYKQALDAMGEGVQRHYQANRHHPEHFAGGVSGMTLVDVMEMVADWKAAADRNGKDVDLDHAANRFGLSTQLVMIIANTLDDLNGE